MEEGGGFTSEEEDPNLYHGDPNLSQFLITEEEQREFHSFNDHNEDAMRSQYKKGKTPLWKVSQENTKIILKARRHVILNLLARLARLMIRFLFLTTRNSEPSSQTSQAYDQVPILTNSEAGRYQLPQSTQSISAQPKWGRSSCGSSSSSGSC